MDTLTSGPTLLTLPAELRNHIYHLVFHSSIDCVTSGSDTSPKTRPFELTDFGKGKTYAPVKRISNNHSSVSRTCRQLYHETHLIHLNAATFQLAGDHCDPKSFESLISGIQPCHQHAVRHIIVTGRIAHLRAMNEQWNSVPFGNERLQLDTLVIIPKRPETHIPAYAEVADLSQSHTLAYVLAETLKCLRGVHRVTVRNQGCFNEAIWRLLYSSLVFRLWRWGGRLCGLGFRGIEGEEAFEILCAGRFDSLRDCSDDETGGTKVGGWRDVLQEMNRLLGEGGSRDGMEDFAQDTGPHI